MNRKVQFGAAEQGHLLPRHVRSGSVDRARPTSPAPSRIRNAMNRLDIPALIWVALAILAAIIEVSIPHFGVIFVSLGAVAAAVVPRSAWSCPRSSSCSSSRSALSLRPACARGWSGSWAPGRAVAHRRADRKRRRRHARHRHRRSAPGASMSAAKTGPRAPHAAACWHARPRRRRGRHRPGGHAA